MELTHDVANGIREVALEIEKRADALKATFKTGEDPQGRVIHLPTPEQNKLHHTYLHAASSLRVGAKRIDILFAGE